MNEDDALAIGLQMKKIVVEHDKYIDSGLARFNLSHSQIRVLGFVLRCDEEGKTVNQRTIENALNLSNPTVSGILTRLEDKHYINRTECTSDARVKLITPTGTSKMLKNSLLDFFDKENDRLTNGFTETELADLKRLLDKVAANLDIKSKRKSLVF